MSDVRKKIIDRYTGRPSPSAVADQPLEPSDDYQAAAPVSGNRPPEIMLELRFRTSDSLALAYALLTSVSWNRSEGIILQFTTHRVQLKGRNLKEIHKALVVHRLAYVQELASPTDDQPEQSAVVANIQVTAL